MRNPLLRLVLLVAAASLLPSCGGRQETAPPAAPPAASPAATVPSPEPSPAAAPQTASAAPEAPTAAAPAPAAAPPSAKPKAAPAPAKAPAVATAPAAAAVPPAAAPAPPAPAPKPAEAAPPAVSGSAAKVADPGGEVAVASTKPGTTRVGAEKCRMCHKVQHESWAASAHAKRTPPLDCESCHGPGSDYRTLAVMKDPAKAKAAGLVMPDPAFCGRCHKGTVDAAFRAKVHAHKARS